MISSWSETPVEHLQTIDGVCLDIDDTLSTSGKLTPSAYQALWDLYDAGFAVVPITGRPAGWCDHIARFWPVDAVVGENGGFSFFMQDGVRREIQTPGLDPKNSEKLEQLGKRIQKEFPKARWASDQAFRQCDLAIDFCEDVPPWSPSEVSRVVEICHEAGAQAKVSSIHINAWFGDFDKRKGFQYWISSGCPGLRKVLPQSRFQNLDRWIFIGDSPNDEPLFGFFENSVGVQNLNSFLQSINSHPRWITKGKSGNGFVEFAQRLISSR